jgi:outer membrane protein OmpA-like peptidoglycan-associated protein
MSTVHATLEQLEAGLVVATGERHTIVIPSTIVRVRLVGMLFDTDKTFLLPSAMTGIRRLAQLYDQHLAKTVLVSGHTDRAGDTVHNLALSVERAQAVAAFLQDEVDDWLPRYKAGKQKSKAWGTLEDQYMLSSLAGGGGMPYLIGAPSGKSDSATVDAIHRFQDENGLAQGAANDDTRRLLIEKYMATDGTTLPDDADILIHGCGESHPSVPTEDSVALAENRRVEVFCFRGPAKPPPSDPCPAGGCAEYPQWVAHTTQTFDINTDAETVVSLVDELGLPLRNATVRVLVPGSTPEEVQTDVNGTIRPRVAPGSSFDVVVLDAHEGGAEDSLTTPSGRHFATGGVAPAADKDDGS